MWIADRAAFLALPAGTVYAKGSRWSFDGPMVKGESLPNDFYYRDFLSPDANDSGELFDRFEAMATGGASFPMDESEQRDGYFDADALFLIYEDADLKAMIRLLDDARYLRHEREVDG